MSARIDLNNEIAREVIALQPAILTMRHEFHRLPEVGWTEYRTASRVCEELSNLGFVVRTGRDVIADDRRLGVPDNNALETAYEKAIAAGAPMPWIELMRGGVCCRSPRGSGVRQGQSGRRGTAPHAMYQDRPGHR